MLNEINLAGSRDLPGSKIMIYYYHDEIVFKDDRYQIYPSAVYEKQEGREEYLLAVGIVRTFRKFNLSLASKIEEIKSGIKEEEIGKTAEEHLEYLAENNLNKRLSALI